MADTPREPATEAGAAARNPAPGVDDAPREPGAQGEPPRAEPTDEMRTGETFRPTSEQKPPIKPHGSISPGVTVADPHHPGTMAWTAGGDPREQQEVGVGTGEPPDTVPTGPQSGEPTAGGAGEAGEQARERQGDSGS